VTDIEQQVSALRADVTAAQQQRARAEHEKAQAQARLEAVAEALKTEFGVTSLADARKLEGVLEEELAEQVTHVRGLLEQVAGGKRSG
jgi:predicted  nucleic acid-binding Zn-ribbon protein